MAFARQWVEPGHRHRAEEQQRAEGADQDADGLNVGGDCWKKVAPSGGAW